MGPVVQGFFDTPTHTISYLVHDPATRIAAIIDPVLDFTPRNARISTQSADALLAAAAKQGLDVRYVLETHAHADHLSAAHHIREKTGAPVVIGTHITQVQKIFAPLFAAEDVTPDGAAFDILLAEGDTLPLGSFSIEALHTPGHTPACLTYVIGDAAFVGDTLFMPDYGTARADFPGGDARTLYQSIQRILSLPSKTRIFVGHDYPPADRSDAAWETTVADERTNNVHVKQGISEDDFVAMREARDKTLEAPLLILPSLQVNIRAGQLPPAAAGEPAFLRLPINRI
ncbi:MAG: MBL fold metallo-hydrolase [Alphaproteobacteria bacterium]|jgi:glyoxylase-like metal-dependent hydrolase (beta-lactamase superfamily II)|nr:MBL fold metallo-hydrolase [Alphaproteobacteria bacterium]